MGDGECEDLVDGRPAPDRNVSKKQLYNRHGLNLAIFRGGIIKGEV